MVKEIVLVDYPEKVQMTEGRRPVYYTPEDTIPLKYVNDRFVFKKKNGRDCLFDQTEKKFILKNASKVDEPRWQSLSFNRISTRVLPAVLIKLKEYMRRHIPDDFVMPAGPVEIHCYIHNQPKRFDWDLDNMHIYYKAFLDLLKDMGYLPDDSIQYVVKSGGFTYSPTKPHKARKMVFEIAQCARYNVKEHKLYKLSPKEPIRLSNQNPMGMKLISSPGEKPGSVKVTGHMILINTGKTKVIHNHAVSVFKKVFIEAINQDTSLTVSEEFYRTFNDYLKDYVMDKGIQVYIRRSND